MFVSNQKDTSVTWGAYNALERVELDSLQGIEIFQSFNVRWPFNLHVDRKSVLKVR